jgi:hypothetical protein
MTKHKKENLEKLLKLIGEISNDPDNFWFKEELGNTYNKEYAFENFPEFIKFQKKQFKIKGNNFYKNITNNELKKSLINDYVEMCWYQSINNIERFALFCFYQMENLLNYYCVSSNSFSKINSNPKKYTIDFGYKFVIDCQKGFLNFGVKGKIEKVSIWAKIVFWMIDSNSEVWEKSNHQNISNLINIRNNESHRNSLNNNKNVSKTVDFLKVSDFSNLGYYIKILKEIIGSIKILGG